MTIKRYPTIFYSLAALCVVASVIFQMAGQIVITGWLIALFFVCIAFAFRGNNLLKGMSFTAIIFASVTLAMFRPQYFVEWGNSN